MHAACECNYCNHTHAYTLACNTLRSCHRCWYMLRDRVSHVVTSTTTERVETVKIKAPQR